MLQNIPMYLCYGKKKWIAYYSLADSAKIYVNCLPTANYFYFNVPKIGPIGESYKGSNPSLSAIYSHPSKYKAIVTFEMATVPKVCLNLSVILIDIQLVNSHH